MSIKDLLISQNVPYKDTGIIKSAEIYKLAGDILGVHTFDKLGIKVDIKDIQKIENGLVVYARAWKGLEQLGFGKNKDVDIERFVIRSLPIMVGDGTFREIQSKLKAIDRKSYETVIIENFVENPVLAMKNTVARLASCSGRVSGRIIKNKEGATTYNEACSNDGCVNKNDGTTGWANVRDAAAGNEVFQLTVNTLNYGDNTPGVREDTGGDYDIFKTFYVWSASGDIDAGDTIDSGTLQIYTASIADGDNDGKDYLAVCEFTPAAPALVVVGDYDQFGYTAWSNTKDLTSGVTSGGYTTFTFNATGLAGLEAQIDGGGTLAVGIQEGHVIENEAIAGGANNRVTSYWTEYAGTDHDPLISLEHTAGGGAATGFMTTKRFW